MTWAKLDDNFHSHPKIREAFRRDPASIGLHAMAISWTSAYEADGRVPTWFIEGVIADESQRHSALDALVSEGLWKRNGEGFVIHDYLDFNPSRAELRAKRDKDADRKRRERGGQ